MFQKSICGKIVEEGLFNLEMLNDYHMNRTFFTKLISTIRYFRMIYKSRDILQTREKCFFL